MARRIRAATYGAEAQPFSSFLLRGFSNVSDKLCNLLKQPPNPFLENSLTHAAAGKLTPSAVDSVLRQSPSSTTAQRSSLLRFFIWAGLQSGYRHSAATYAAACKTLLLTQHPETVTHLLDTYKRENVPVNVRTFKIFLELCRHGGIVDRALELLRRMPEFNCLPDTSSYNSALRLLVAEKKVNEAKNLVKEMLSSGIFPDMVTCISMVKALCDGGDFQEARSFVKKMPSFGCNPNVVIFSALIDGACYSGEIHAAIEILSEMESSAVDEFRRPNVVTYTCLMKCLCERGMMDDAMLMYDRMVSQGCHANRVTIATLLWGFCRWKMVAEAFSLAGKVSGGGEDSYSSLILSLVRAGDAEEAEALAKSMLQRGVNPDGASRNVLVREIVNSGGVDRGIRWVEDISAAGLTLDPEVYSSLLEFAVRERKLTEAVGLVEWMTKKGIKLKVNSSSVAEALAKTLEKIGRVDLAQRIVLID